MFVAGNRICANSNGIFVAGCGIRADGSSIQCCRFGHAAHGVRVIGDSPGVETDSCRLFTQGNRGRANGNDVARIRRGAIGSGDTLSRTVGKVTDHDAAVVIGIFAACLITENNRTVQRRVIPGQMAHEDVTITYGHAAGNATDGNVVITRQPLSCSGTDGDVRTRAKTWECLILAVVTG